MWGHSECEWPSVSLVISWNSNIEIEKTGRQSIYRELTFGFVWKLLNVILLPSVVINVLINLRWQCSFEILNMFCCVCIYKTTQPFSWFYYILLRYLSKKNDCLQYLWSRNRYKEKAFNDRVISHSKPPVFLFVSGQKCTFVVGSADELNSWMQHAKYFKCLPTRSFTTVILCSKYENQLTNGIHNNNKERFRYEYH